MRGQDGASKSLDFDESTYFVIEKIGWGKHFFFYVHSVDFSLFSRVNNGSQVTQWASWQKVSHRAFYSHDRQNKASVYWSKRGQWPVTFSNRFSLTSSQKVGFSKMIHVLFYLVLIGNVDTSFPPKLSLVFPNRPHSQNFHCREILSKLVGKLVNLGASSAPGVLMLTCITGSQLRTSENKRRKTLWNVISTWDMPDRKESSPL